ncbi:hypothetical protein CLOP_g20589 [Closterium sp. NIES-67]|nr:hypothetical protein CLOP_g20589 [Closterium sp. NIES-67]
MSSSSANRDFGLVNGEKGTHSTGGLTREGGQEAQPCCGAWQRKRRLAPYKRGTNVTLTAWTATEQRQQSGGAESPRNGDGKEQEGETRETAWGKDGTGGGMERDHTGEGR